MTEQEKNRDSILRRKQITKEVVHKLLHGLNVDEEILEDKILGIYLAQVCHMYYIYR